PSPSWSPTAPRTSWKTCSRQSPYLHASPMASLRSSPTPATHSCSSTPNGSAASSSASPRSGTRGAPRASRGTSRSSPGPVRGGRRFRGTRGAGVAEVFVELLLGDVTDTELHCADQLASVVGRCLCCGLRDHQWTRRRSPAVLPPLFLPLGQPSQ